MSAAQFGNKLVSKGRDVTEKMMDGVYTGVSKGNMQGGAKQVQFQRKFDARSPYDDEMNMKMELMDKDGMTPFGQVYYDDKVGKWLQRKEAAEEAANFDAYFNANFNNTDLASLEFAKDINPEFFASREREMDDRIEVVRTLKKIQLRGPQNEEELHMLYLIETGRAKLPEDWDRIGPAFEGAKMKKKDRKQNEKQFARGLVHFPKFLNQERRQDAASDNDAAGAWGDRVSAVNFFKGAEKKEDVPNKRNKPLAKPGKAKDDKTMGFNFSRFLTSGY